jgi:hypothetical protein
MCFHEGEAASLEKAACKEMWRDSNFMCIQANVPKIHEAFRAEFIESCNARRSCADNIENCRKYRVLADSLCASIIAN